MANSNRVTETIQFGQFSSNEDGHVRASLKESVPDEVPEAPEDEGPWTVHGVLLGEDEVTMGQHGAKFWPSEEQQKAYPSLVGKEFSVAHEDEAVESGEVTRAAFQPNLGTVWEADVDSWETAAALSNGQYDVSLEASVPNHDHVARTPEGLPYMTDYEYNRVAAVEGGTGAAEASYTAFGSASDNPAIAALSQGENAESFHSSIEAALAHADATGAGGGASEMVDATIQVDVGSFPIDRDTLLALAENHDIGYTAFLEAASEISPDNVTIEATEEQPNIRIF